MKLHKSDRSITSTQRISPWWLHGKETRNSTDMLSILSKNIETYPKAFVNNEITINNGIWKVLNIFTFSYCTTPKKLKHQHFKCKQTVLKVGHRWTQYVLPLNANPEQHFSFSKNCVLFFFFKKVYPWPVTVTGQIFLNFKNYGSDGRLSTSLLSQMID